MDIEKIIDFKFIPEEYTQQIFTLLLSNDIDNWELIYQLFIGFGSSYPDTVMNVSDYYFVKMMKSYLAYCKWQEVDKIEKILKCKEYGN